MTNLVYFDKEIENAFQRENKAKAPNVPAKLFLFTSPDGDCNGVLSYLTRRELVANFSTKYFIVSMMLGDKAVSEAIQLAKEKLKGRSIQVLLCGHGDIFGIRFGVGKYDSSEVSSDDFVGTEGDIIFIACKVQYLAEKISRETNRIVQAPGYPIISFYFIEETGTIAYMDEQGDVFSCIYKPRAIESRDIIEKVLKKATDGDPLAQTFLARHAYHKEDWKTCLSWARLAADQGSTRAKFLIGLCYQNGLGVAENKGIASDLFEEIIEDLPETGLELWHNYYNGTGRQRSNEKGIFFLKKAAENKNLNAQYNLAGCYNFGLGVRCSEDQAFYWWKKAASQGHSDSLYQVGMCYLNGKGVQRDLDAAFEYIFQARNQGHPTAWTALLLLAELGNLKALLTVISGHCRTEANLQEAEKWMRKALQMNSQKVLEMLEKQMDTLCTRYLRFLNSGIPDANDILDIGHLGSSEAHYLLGRYLFKRGEENDALRWMKLASKEGYAQASLWLGDYFFERGKEKEALPWITLAASQSFARAQLWLAHFYQEGRGVSVFERWRGVHQKKAKYWFERAASSLPDAHDQSRFLLMDASPSFKHGRMVSENGTVYL